VSSCVRGRGRVVTSGVLKRNGERYQTLKCLGQTVITCASAPRTANARMCNINEQHSRIKRDSGSARLMKACRYSRKLYAGLPRATYLHGKQSLARLSDVLILWKQFLRRCTSDKDAAVSGVVVCTEGKGINQHDRKTGILSSRWWINGRNVARNAVCAFAMCHYLRKRILFIIDFYVFRPFIVSFPYFESDITQKIWLLSYYHKLGNLSITKSNMKLT